MKSKINSEVFNNKENQSKGTKLSLKKILSWSLTLVILSGIIWYGFTKINYIVENWGAISFAYQKPLLVNTLREKYASRSAEVEQSMFDRKPDPKDQLIEEVTNQLKSSKE